MHEIAFRYVPFREKCNVRNTGSVMQRAVRITLGDAQTLGVHEKLVHRLYHAVPRTDTGALAEKAKT